MVRVLRKTLLATVVAAVLVGFITAFASAAPKPNNPTITFVPPSPDVGASLETNSVSFAFTYNRKPAATRELVCTLDGPTPFAERDCSDPTTLGSGSRSVNNDYSGLANGQYTFTISLTLTDGGTASASRSFTVAVNQPPVANDVSATTREDETVTITLSASDADSAGPGTVAVTDPGHGTLGPVIPISSFIWQVGYTPDANFSGPDSFTYKVTDDGGANSNVATVSIIVIPVED
jgi:Big-like domain-containing protein